MLDRPQVGRAVDGRVDDRPASHHRLEAVRAHLLEMAGDTDSAIIHYQRAAGRTASLAERDYSTATVTRLR